MIAVTGQRGEPDPAGTAESRHATTPADDASAPADPDAGEAPVSGAPVSGPSISDPRDTDAPTTSFVPTIPATDYDDAGVPSLEYLQDKIERRYATSLGATELARDAPAGQSQAEQQEERDRLATERLEQIRQSLSRDQ